MYDGSIESHTLTHSYHFDDVEMYSVPYDSMSAQRSVRPVSYENERFTDSQPIYVASLTAETLQNHLDSFDESTLRFWGELEAEALRSRAEIPREEHIRRALGMLSMVASGHRPTRWYNGLYKVSRWLGR